MYIRVDLDLPAKYMKKIPKHKDYEFKKSKLTSKDISRLISLSGQIRKWKKQALSPIKIQFIFEKKAIKIYITFRAIKKDNENLNHNPLFISDFLKIATFKLNSIQISNGSINDNIQTSSAKLNGNSLKN